MKTQIHKKAFCKKKEEKKKKNGDRLVFLIQMYFSLFKPGVITG